MSSRTTKTGGLDSTDQAILAALQADGRASLSKLARHLSLSQPAVSERVRRLEDRGIIKGYGVRLDLRALGLTTSAIIRLRTTHDRIRACLEKFAAMPEIIDVHRITGEDCFFVRVVVPVPNDLERIVDSLAVFGPVTTSVVLRSEPEKPISATLIKAVRR